MMEESEKRRERLKAMRLAAGQGGGQGDDGHSLVNPLLEPSLIPSVQEPNVAHRFDYYTDPMSAFSANKSRGKVSHQSSPEYFKPPRPRNADMTPAYQAQTIYPSDPRMFQNPGYYHSPGPYGRPMGSPGAFGTPQQGNMNVGAYRFPSNLSRGGNFRRPDFVQRGSPSASYGGSGGYGMNNSPQSNWGRPYPHSGRGRTQWLGGNSPQTGSGDIGGPYHHHSGRGRSHWRGNNPGSMQSSRRIGSRDDVSAEVRPDLYYDKSMIEDPWESLKPVISRRGGRTSLSTPDSSKSWLPASISSKKARVSEALSKISAGRSLAEELAASFHAAASSEPQDDSDENN